jgi:hypothetical protein
MCLVFQNSFLVWVNKDNTIGGLYGKVWADLEKHLNFKYVNKITLCSAKIDVDPYD